MDDLFRIKSGCGQRAAEKCRKTASEPTRASGFHEPDFWCKEEYIEVRTTLRTLWLNSNMIWKEVSREPLGTWPCIRATRDAAPEVSLVSWNMVVPTENSKKRPGLQPRIMRNMAVLPVDRLRLQQWMEHLFNCFCVDLTATAK